MSRHASLLLLASAACVDGFGGPALMRQPPRTPARAHLSAPVMAFGLSFGGRSEEPAGPSEEAQALYRMLGVSEDATYDEIVDGYDALCAKYKGETKKLIKLQVRTDPCAVLRVHRARTAHTPGTHRARTAHAPRTHRAPTSRHLEVFLALLLDAPSLPLTLHTHTHTHKHTHTNTHTHTHRLPRIRS